MRKVLIGLALAVCAAAPAAAVQFTVTPGTVTAVPNNNNFKSNLSALGLVNYASRTGTSISLTGPATLTFEYIGSESGYRNKFTVTGVSGFSYQEGSGGLEAWNAAGVDFGTALAYPGGAITNWQFSSPGKPTPGPFGLGTEQFGVFLPGRVAFSSNVIYLGYDDEPGSDDDNHDDMIIRITAVGNGGPLGGVPEPASWAMLIAGFGLVGAAQRRRTAMLSA
jgi:PEP-CTERM motif